ncbi:MAG TPA: restriction endonuclease subunit S [Mariprofundaceae bacterium]|nr:restriction endonuclease subunit S [Mariprofundaceae bacterium]
MSKFSDYVELNPKVSLKKGESVPFISMGDITLGNRWVRPQTTRSAGGSGSKFSPGDILFARITPCLENGKISQYAGEIPGLGSTEFFVLRARKGMADPSYIYYFSQDKKFRSVAEKSMSGASGRQRADISALSEYECNFPTFSIQSRIAEILSAYDELIENNLRRIKVLEEMARSLYREWFVNFRYPGHESISLVGSLVGPIPKDWALKALTECIEVKPSVVVPREGEKPFVPMGCLSNDSMLISDIESRAGSSGSKFQNGDTLFARITPCLENGKTGFVQFLPNEKAVAFGSTEFIVLRSKALTPQYVYCMARSDEFRDVAIKSMTGASGRQRVQESCFGQISITRPPQWLLDKFTSTTEPMFRFIYKLQTQTENLRRTRDMLLPKLLSGQLTISGM